MVEAMIDVCPECQAVQPWIVENDESICRQCGHVKHGMESARLHNESKYITPLLEVYLKNPANRDETAGSSKRSKYGKDVSQRQRSEGDLFRQIDGCVRNTLRLPSTISHRAWHLLEMIKQKRGKKNVTVGMKSMAMSITLVAAREAGHQVSNTQIASLTRRPLGDIEEDLRCICKFLEKPYEKYRGISEHTQRLVQAAPAIAQAYKQKNLSEFVLSDKHFTSTLQFCLAYQSRMHLIDHTISQVQRMWQLTGIWHKRKLEVCDVTTVFIALQLIAGRYLRHHYGLMNEFRKHVEFNPEACQLRMREFQRLALDLAFYLPQIGKARFIPALLEPWNGRTERHVPVGQLFILLLPDVLENVQPLWEKRLHDLKLQGDEIVKRDVQARLRTALSAFLSPPEGYAIVARPPSVHQSQPTPQVDDKADSTDDVCSSSLQSSPAQQSRRVLLGSTQGVPSSSAPPTFSAHPSPPETWVAGPQSSNTVQISRNRKRKPDDEMGDSERMTKRTDRRRKEHRSAMDSNAERRLQEARLDKFKQLMNTKQTEEHLRQQSRLEVAAERFASGALTPARAAYGVGHVIDRGPAPLPLRKREVLDVLEKWQSTQLVQGRSSLRAPRPPYRSCYEYDTYRLKKDLLDGHPASSIDLCRFPQSITGAKAMLYDFDIQCPFIGSDDDSLFEPDELEACLGDEQYTKAWLEVWRAKGMDECVARKKEVGARALQVASQRQPKVKELAGLRRAEDKYDTKRMAELLANMREDSEPLQDVVDTYISREIGQGISMAVASTGEGLSYDSLGDHQKDDSNDEHEEDIDMYESNEKVDDEGLEVVGDYAMPAWISAYHRRQYSDEEDGAADESDYD